jgi:hypothetical protein
MSPLGVRRISGRAHRNARDRDARGAVGDDVECGVGDERVADAAPSGNEARKPTRAA